MKSCYIYTRVSTIAQVDGYSLDAQIKALRDYAEYKELRIAGEYCDAGKSGMTIRNRPQFSQMMDDVMAQKDNISYVLVFKLSRFGRNAADILKSLQTLEDYEVNLVSVNESIDSSTQGGRLTLSILAAVAEMEHENISVQFMAGRLQAVKNGGWPGGAAPYGYRIAGHALIQDPYEAEVVRKIYELYDQNGSNASSVAFAMNNSGYVLKDKKTGVGKPLTYDFVKGVLDNPVYCGRIRYNRRTNKKGSDGKIIKYDSDHSLEVEGRHEGIIKEETWERIHQKRLLIAESYKKENEYVHILSGLVRCPECGRGLVGAISRTKKPKSDEYYDKKLQYYTCRYHTRQKGHTCSYSRLLNEEIIDGLVFEIISGLQFNEEFKAMLEKALGTSDSTDDLKQKLRQLHEDLRTTEFLKDRLGKQLDGLNPLKADYDQRYEKLSSKLDSAYDRIDALEDQIKTAREMVQTAEQKTQTIAKMNAFLTDMKPMLKRMTAAEKKEFCNSFIDRIDLFPEERSDGKLIRSISFRFPLAFNGADLRADGKGGTVCFTLDCENIDIQLPEHENIAVDMLPDGSQKVIIKKPTYSAIKKYVTEKFGVNVHTLYIAQIKRKYGIDVGEAYNKLKEPHSRVPHCPPEKEKMILDAFKHFDLLDESVEYKEGE